jgi:two-component system sensor histidine kinase CpxA
LKTLKLRIVVICAVAFITAALAILWISASYSHRFTVEFFEGAVKLELLQAQRIYENNGPGSLANYLEETDAALGGTRYLTDARGHDVISGQDHSRMIPTGFDLLGFPRQSDGKDIVIRSSSDGRYHLIVAAPPPFNELSFLPYFLAAGLLSALLGWVLSIAVLSPLKQVANAMADRIQTLLTSERRLLQDVSHELRSPLSRLSFAVELMKNTEDREAAASRIRREIRRLSQLVSTILEVNSSESDLCSRRTQPVTMATLTEEIVADCSFEARSRNIQIVAELSTFNIVDGDPELLRRAIENVLRNAIRFSPVQASILVQVDDGDSEVQIRIRDYGPGVPEDQLAHIFDPFFRVDESRDRAVGGVGFGLSIARRAVLLHRGEIWAENANPGLQVSITLPISQVLSKG